jgi:hypothetical protein
VVPCESAPLNCATLTEWWPFLCRNSKQRSAFAAVAVVVDRYEEDWGQLGWVMLRGHAEILIDGREHDQAQALLRSRYPQLKCMQITELPVIAVRIVSATSWGNLSLANSD